MTEFTNQVVRVGKIEKHPNADTLGVVKVFDSYDCVVKLGSVNEGDLVGYICLQADLDTSLPEFSFLLPKSRANGRYRLRAMKIRSVFSQGLLVPLPAGCKLKEGDSIDELFRIEKYLPPSEREKPKTYHSAHKKARISDTWPQEKQYWYQALLSISLSNILLGFLKFPIWMSIVLPVIIVPAITYARIKYLRYNSRKPSIPYFDLHALNRLPLDVFTEGEEVSVSEKLHGSWSGFIWTGNKFFMKSRTVFRGTGQRPDTTQWGFSFDDVWKLVAVKYRLEEKLKNHPMMCVMGEIIGPKIQKGFDYGYVNAGTSDAIVPTANQYGFAAFDVLNVATRKYLDTDEFLSFCKQLDIPTVPVVYRGPWNEKLKELCEGKSTYPGAKHIREGIVIRPLVERHDDRIGRVCPKLVGKGYLLRNAEITEDDEEAA